MKNKRGWIKIVEAFLAIILITGALLIVVEQRRSGIEENEQKIYDAETEILREIELNSQMRTQVLGVEDAELGKDGNVPQEIEEYMEEGLPDNLYCEFKICELDKICSLDNYADTNVYSQSVAITTNTTTYSPRQLKAFCFTEKPDDKDGEDDEDEGGEDKDDDEEGPTPEPEPEMAELDVDYELYQKNWGTKPRTESIYWWYYNITIEEISEETGVELISRQKCYKDTSKTCTIDREDTYPTDPDAWKDGCWCDPVKNDLGTLLDKTFINAGGEAKNVDKRWIDCTQTGEEGMVREYIDSEDTEGNNLTISYEITFSCN